MNVAELRAWLADKPAGTSGAVMGKEWSGNPPPASHRCVLPRVGGYTVGSKWKCPHCATSWRVQYGLIKNRWKKL